MSVIEGYPGQQTMPGTRRRSQISTDSYLMRKDSNEIGTPTDPNFGQIQIKIIFPIDIVVRVLSELLEISFVEYFSRKRR